MVLKKKHQKEKYLVSGTLKFLYYKIGLVNFKHQNYRRVIVYQIKGLNEKQMKNGIILPIHDRG